MELKEIKELRVTSKALKNRLSDYSVIKEVGIIYISACVVAITFITLKEEIKAETETIGTRDIYRSPITELIGFKIDIVLIKTKIGIVLVRIKINIILVETKEDIILVGIKMDIVLAGTKTDIVLVNIVLVDIVLVDIVLVDIVLVDIVLVETKMDIVLVRTETVLVLVGTEIDIARVRTEIDMVLIGPKIDIYFIEFKIDIVWLNIKMLLTIIRLSPFVNYVDRKESSYIDLKRVVKLLKYLFKLRIKLIDLKAPLREFREVYINLNIWLESNISGSAIKYNSLLEGCMVVITIPRELMDFKVKSIIVLIKEI